MTAPTSIRLRRPGGKRLCTAPETDLRVGGTVP